MTPTQDLIATLVGIVLLAALGWFSLHKHFKKRESLKAPPIPWIIVTMGCIATLFMVLVHLVNLLGFETGR